MKIATAALLLLGCFITSAASAQALQWRIGVAYASGLSDVTDLYEDEFRKAGFDVNVDVKFPLGLAGGVSYDWASGLRADAGLGPVFVIGGDVKHSEMPLVLTVGYNFMRDSDFSPFVRAGVSYHFVDGDLYESSKVGPFVAAGVDFTHFTLEVALDKSKVDFDSLDCPAGGGACQLTTTDLSTYDVLAAVYWRFQ
jgi:hypothetical protein